MFELNFRHFSYLNKFGAFSSIVLGFFVVFQFIQAKKHVFTMTFAKLIQHHYGG
jgi:hypothetical protein